MWDPDGHFMMLSFDGYVAAYAIKTVEDRENLILGFADKADGTRVNIQWKHGSAYQLTDDGADLDRGFEGNNANSLGNHSSTLSSNGVDLPMVKSNEVPEPGSLWLLGLGLGALGIHVRRRFMRR